MRDKLRIYAAVVFLTMVLLPGCGRMDGTDKAIEPEIKNNVYLGNINFGGLKKSEAMEKIIKNAEGIDVQVREAKLNQNTWEIEGKEKIGQKLNIEETLNRLINSKEGDKVSLVVEEIYPKLTTEKLRDNIKLIGSFTTPLLDKQDSRLNNIEIASEWIDYSIVNPGEEFSFNRSLGKRTKSKGYEQAPIIKRTEEGSKKGYGVGGGICQLSSTLYNAVERGGLEILERHNHSKDVGYVPKGMDATVSYGSSDFRFRNNRNYSVMVRVYLGENNLTVKVFENRNDLM